MEDKRVKLNELKEGLIRCIIPYKDNDGKEKQIEVYSIEGELIAQSRLIMITGLEKQMEKELEVFTKQIENSNKMMNKDE